MRYRRRDRVEKKRDRRETKGDAKGKIKGEKQKIDRGET